MICCALVEITNFIKHLPFCCHSREGGNPAYLFISSYKKIQLISPVKIFNDGCRAESAAAAGTENTVSSSRTDHMAHGKHAYPGA
jgi:hypothetical protein